MLHKKISVSSQVNKLSLPAKLLFTWMIAHTDDEGRMKGDPEIIKATVVPMTKWSFKKIQNYLTEIKNQQLIYYWEQNNEWFIEFVKWNDYQSIRKDRVQPSKLPSFPNEKANNVSVTSQPNDNQVAIHNEVTVNKETAQSNIKETNPIENSVIKEVVDKKTTNDVGEMLNPRYFVPKSEIEAIALETWRKLEPTHNWAFYPIYLKAARKGLPIPLFGQFASEIEQDPTIRDKGRVFNKKVNDYFCTHRG